MQTISTVTLTLDLGHWTLDSNMPNSASISGKIKDNPISYDLGGDNLAQRTLSHEKS